MWLRETTRIYNGVNLATGAVTTINFTGPIVGSSDVAFVREGGTNYLIAVGNTRVALLDLDSGTSTRKNITGLPASGGFGASWTDASGRTFSFHNDTGQIFELFDLFTPTPSAVLVAQGDPSNNNDGFSCNTAPFPICRLFGQ